MQLSLIEYGAEQITPEKKNTQRNIVLEMLARNPQSCSDFMRKGIAQYNARIKELRQEGYNISYISKYKVFRMNI